MVYGHANGRDIEETGDEVEKYIEQGYLACAHSPVCPDCHDYGVSDDKMFYEPAAKGLPLRMCGPQRNT